MERLSPSLSVQSGRNCREALKEKRPSSWRQQGEKQQTNSKNGLEKAQ
jgi:hypothetical protein